MGYKEQEKVIMITKKQLTALAVNAIIVKMLLTLPRNIFAVCGQAAWLAGVYTTLLALGLFYATQKIYPGNENIIGIAMRIGGKRLKIVVGLIVFAVLALNIMSIIRIFPEIIRLVLLQKTYLEIIGTVFVLAIIFGASCGIESVARVHEMFLPVASVVFAAFIIMLIPEMDFNNLFPILGEGPAALFGGGLIGMSVFSDLLLLNVLIPSVENTDAYRKSGIKAIIIGGICSCVILFLYALSYVNPASAEFIIPIYQLERLINLSDFFSRLEALFQFIWSISILLYCSLYIAVLALIWRDTFDLRHSKPLVAPISIMLVGAAIVPNSLNDMIAVESIINKWVYIPAFAIPIIMGGALKYKMFHVKHKKGGGANE